MRHPSLEERFDPAVRIVEYDPAWPRLAAAEIARVGAALDGVAVRIEHVGSTAVPGLAAKPIVDLQVAVAEIRPAAPYAEPLEALGYLFAPDPESPDFHFFGLPAARPRTHHLHVCLAGGADEMRHLAVRDYLRAHPEEAARYAALKRELVASRPGDRLAYVEGKAEFVAALERRAVMFVGGGGFR
ncbi:MAG: GrpB family protein [Actinobacteria bacterium]|nr:GrpB family protein [Actinomycetota bacterium]